MQYTAHLPYWVIIIALSGWLIFEKNSARGRELNLASDQTLKMAGELLERENTTMMMTIDKNQYDYPSPQSDDYGKRAKRLVSFTDRTIQDLTSLRHLVYEHKVEENELFAMLQKTTKAFQDTIALLSDYDESLQPSFPDLALNGYELPEAWLWGFIPTARTEEILLILRNIISRVRSSETAVLRDLDRKMSGKDVMICFPGPVISVSPKNPAPKAGEWYTAEVFASMYERPKNRNMRVRVDGNELEIKDGVATFQRRYTIPGEKKYTVEFLFTNPQTKTTKSIIKEFSVTVVDSCK